MATPSEIRDEALKLLRAMQKHLNSPTWILSLESQSAEVQTEAAERQLEVQRMRVKLENAKLEEIRDALVANEAELAKGRSNLERSLKSLKRVRSVLDAVGAMVGSLAKALATRTG